MKKKTVALLMALVLIFGVAAGGTVAWLTDKTETVVNTFTDSDINITLVETTTANGTATANSYKMVPGDKITKDPMVTVKAGSEACWLFVQLEESTKTYTVGEGESAKKYGFDDFLTYSVDSDWKAVAGKDNVYYRIVNASDTDQSFYVLAPGRTDAENKEYDQLTVKDTVTKAMMNAIGDDYPTLSVTAYAIQSANLTFTDAATTDELKAAEAYTMATTNP